MSRLRRESVKNGHRRQRAVRRKLWPRGRTLSHNKVCNLEDFSHPDLRTIIKEVFSYETGRYGSEFPKGREYRKYWEVAMAIRALSDLGAMHEEAEILGVGAGNEPTLFYLTSRVKRVFATDLYLEPGIWTEFANSSMLTDPASHWPSEWNPRRLITQHMNGLDLKYEDNSFDGIFSSSSIEHFGDLGAVQQCMKEMFRVLKPGGILTLATEFRIQGPSPGLPGCLMFDGPELKEQLIGVLPWNLVSPLDLKISRATLASEKLQDDLVEDLDKHFADFGQLVHHQVDFRSYPQIVLRLGDHVFTSVHLALRKEGRKKASLSRYG